MALYIYLKKEIKNSYKFPAFPKLKPLPKITNALSLMMIAAGFGMLLLVLYPIAKWQITSPNIAPENFLVKPIPDNKNQTSPNDVLAKENEKDLTVASNWFSNSPQVKKESKIKEFFLSIPKLNIDQAVVKVGGEDLTGSLINYEGTALPGEYGNTVIFGHSVLPEFYDPKNYLTIFTEIPALKPGDEIEAIVDDVTYKYVVYDLKTVDPTDISVLEQRYDNYYLSLVTCVPPGLKWKRLVVRAKLQIPTAPETQTE